MPAAPRGRRLTIAVAAAFAVFAIVPLGVIAAVPRLHDGGKNAVHVGQTLIPVSGSVGLRATLAGETVRLAWNDSEPRTASGFYHVLRTHSGGDVFCAGRTNASSDNCTLYTDSVTTTRGRTFADRPGSGTWTYRIGIAANWVDDPTLGDIYVVSTPMTVTVG